MQVQSTPKAAIYVRVSSAGQEDGYSLDTQLKACQKYAAEHGYDVAATFREVHTGVELWERPQLAAMREAVRRREVQAVIAYAIDRLSRDPVHLGVILSEADHAGATVAFVSEPLDDSPEGQLIRFVRGYAAKIEHAKIVERTLRGRRARAAGGKPLAGPRPPYGYQWVTRPITRGGSVVQDKVGCSLDPVTAPIVRRIFSEALAGRSLRAITTDLNKQAVPTPSGKSVHWPFTSVRRILVDERYTGAAKGLRWLVEKQEGKRIVRQRPDADRLPMPEGTFPSIITPEEFQSVAAIMRLNQQSAVRSTAHPERFLLRAGFIHCDHCGQRMSVRGRPAPNGPQYGCMTGTRAPGVCRVHHVSARRADARAWERVKMLLTSRELIATELERLRESDQSEADLAAIDRSLAAITRRQTVTARSIALLTDADAAAPLVATLESLAQQRRQLEADRATMIAQRSDWQNARRQLTDLDRWCEAMAETLDTLDYAGRRRVLQALGVDVRVSLTGEIDVVTAIKLPDPFHIARS